MIDVKPRYDPREIQQINFTGNLNRAEDATSKISVSDFSKGRVKVSWFDFVLTLI